MSNDSNAAARLLSAEAKEQLKASCNEELKKILKLRLLHQQLKGLRSKVSQTEGNEQIIRALKVLSITDYIKLGDKEKCVLDLNDLRPSINLSYTERKTVRQRLIEQLNKNLRPLVDYYKLMHKELAECDAITCPPTNNNSKQQISALECAGEKLISAQGQQLLQLEAQRRENILKLAQTRNLKCGYMKAAAELKTGPYLANKLQILEGQARLNQIKTNLLRDFFVNELVTRTEHSVKAIKEVEGYVNEQIEKLEE